MWGFPVIVSEKSPPQAIAGTEGNQGENCDPELVNDAMFGNGLFTIGLIIFWALAWGVMELRFVTISMVPEARRNNVNISTWPVLDQVQALLTSKTNKQLST